MVFATAALGSLCENGQRCFLFDRGLHSRCNRSPEKHEYRDTPLEMRGGTYVNQKPYDTGVVDRAERRVIAEDILKYEARLPDLIVYLKSSKRNISKLRGLYLLERDTRSCSDRLPEDQPHIEILRF
jgi:hypothetical protein